LFYCAWAEIAIILLLVRFLSPNLQFPWAISCTTTNSDGISAKIYVFERKTCFVMENLGVWGLVGVGKKILSKPPKGKSMADFTRFESLFVQICSLGKPTKKGHSKKSQRGYILPTGGEFPTQPNSTEFGIWVGVTDIIITPSFVMIVEGVQSYRGSNFALLHRNSLSPAFTFITLTNLCCTTCMPSGTYLLTVCRLECMKLAAYQNGATIPWSTNTQQVKLT